MRTSVGEKLNLINLNGAEDNVCVTRGTLVHIGLGNNEDGLRRAK